jgi:hypothetical protein
VPQNEEARRITLLVNIWPISAPDCSGFLPLSAHSTSVASTKSSKGLLEMSLVAYEEIPVKMPTLSEGKNDPDAVLAQTPVHQAAKAPGSTSADAFLLVPRKGKKKR